MYLVLPGLYVGGESAAIRPKTLKTAGTPIKQKISPFLVISLANVFGKT